MQAENRIRRLLNEGKTVTGMLLFTGSPVVVEMMAAAGLDFVIIDMEHSALDLDRAGHLVRAADAAGITPFVRVPEVDAALIKKLLNLAAAGIVLPHANRENCAALLNAMRYAPEGERGACQIVRAAGYTRGGWDGMPASEPGGHGDPADRGGGKHRAISSRSRDARPRCLFCRANRPFNFARGAGSHFRRSQDGRRAGRGSGRVRRHGKYAMTLIGNNLDIEYGRRIARRGVQIMVLGTDGDLFYRDCGCSAWTRQEPGPETARAPPPILLAGRNCRGVDTCAHEDLIRRRSRTTPHDGPRQGDGRAGEAREAQGAKAF